MTHWKLLIWQLTHSDSSQNMHKQHSSVLQQRGSEHTSLASSQRELNHVAKAGNRTSPGS